MNIIQTLGSADGPLVYRTVVREYRAGCIQQAVYRTAEGRVVKYWACEKGCQHAKEFDTEGLATAYLHRNVRWR